MARKDFDNFFYKYLEDLTNTDRNSKIFKSIFSKMSDAQLKKWLTDATQGTKKITLTMPNLSDEKVTIEKMIPLANKIGVKLFDNLVIKSDDPDIPTYTTPNKYLVVMAPVFRVSQASDLVSKVPKSYTNVDAVKGTPIGDSEGSSMSKDELQILAGMGLDKSLKEIFKIKGGDTSGFNAYIASLNAKGSVSLEEIAQYTGEVGSKTLTRILFNAAHISTDL